MENENDAVIFVTINQKSIIKYPVLIDIEMLFIDSSILSNC